MDDLDAYTTAMDITLVDMDLTPALRDALDRAAAGAETMRVVSVQGGYRIVNHGGEPVGDRRPCGSARLGDMRHLGRDLPDLD